MQESQWLPGTAGGLACQDWEGAVLCCGELALNLRASSTRARGLTAVSGREDGRSPLGGGTGVSGGLLSLAGFSHLPSGLYPSYLHLNHLEPPSSGSPLLSQLGQPSIFDTQKGQTAGVVGTLGGGLWNGMGGGPLPQHSRPPPWLCFPRLQPREAPTGSWGPPIAFWDLLAVGSSSNPIGPSGQLLILASPPFIDEETEAQKG